MKKSNNLGFTIIEILIGIFIFTIGITSVYMLILSTMQLNDYSKNSIIASNLAKQDIEIIKNIRDNNYFQTNLWNKLNSSNSQFFNTGVYYKVENDLSNDSTTGYNISKIDDFAEGKDFLKNKMLNYNLCIVDGIYTYKCEGSYKKTYFYKYLKFDDVIYMDSGVKKVMKDSLKITSKVIWYNSGYHEIELKTIITDWQRL